MLTINNIKKKIIDYNKLKNSFNNSDNFINNSHRINSTNYLNNSSFFNNSERKTKKNSGSTGKTTVFQHYSGIKKIIDDYKGNTSIWNLDRVFLGKKIIHKKLNNLKCQYWMKMD